MKNFIITIVTCLALVSCSKTDDGFKVVEDPRVGARLPSETHIQFPTLKSRLIEEAQADLKETGNDSKLVGLDEIGHLKLVDSLYASDFQKVVLARKEDGVNLINQYNTLIASYSHNPYQQAHLQSGLARKILLNVGLINSEDFTSISFFTNQLLDSHLGEYQLIIRCLESLNGKIPVDEFNAMGAKLHQQIEISRINEVELAKGIKEMIVKREKQLAADPSQKKGRLMLNLMKEVDLDLRQSILEQCSDRLSKL